MRKLAAKSIGRFGTNAVAAVPVLIGCLADRDLKVAEEAAAALGTLRMEPEIAVPALANCALKSPNDDVRRSAHTHFGRVCWSS